MNPLLQAMRSRPMFKAASSNLDIGDSGPPPAVGVTPGPAYGSGGGLPSYGSGGPNVYAPGGGPSFQTPLPPSLGIPDWIYPTYGNAGGTPNVGGPTGTPSGYPPQSNNPPTFGPPLGGTGPVALWNGPGAANIHDPENAQSGALAARFGLMGRGAAGKWRGRFQ